MRIKRHYLSVEELFHEIIAGLINKSHWKWLHRFISWLCDVEMGIKLTDDLKNLLAFGEVEKYIPENSFYCDGCLFADKSKIARFFFGNDGCGYCHYLKRGDYSVENSTDILWDGCKECGVNEDSSVSI